MKRLLCLALCLVMPLAGLAAPPQAGAEPDVKIPGKWLKDAKGYAEALEIQQATGADIFLYFARMVPDDQKGLCRWWEKHRMQAGSVRKLLKEYIKVQVTLPSKRDDEELAEQFRVGKCPTICIIQADGTKSFCKVFDWPGGKPELKRDDELEEMFRSRSSARYQARD